MGKIAAIDFDGTLVTEDYPFIGSPILKTIRYVKMLKDTGWKLILWTCRTGGELEEAVEFCKKQGITFDAVNESLPISKARYGRNPRKILADIFIDDRALNPNDIV